MKKDIEPKLLPVVPLRDMVVFPHMMAPFVVGRQPSVVSGWWNWLRASAASRLFPRSVVAFLARDVVAGYTPPDRR